MKYRFVLNDEIKYKMMYTRHDECMIDKNYCTYRYNMSGHCLSKEKQIIKISLRYANMKKKYIVRIIYKMEKKN